MTDHFTFFASYYEAIEELEADIKAEFFDVLFKYALRDEAPSDTVNPIVKALFTMAKPNLDKSKAKREAGKHGGSKPKANRKQTPSKPKQTPSDKEKEIGEGIGEGNIIVMPPENRIANYLLQKILSEKPNFKKPNLTTWYKDIELAMRLDGRSEEELTGCINWIYSKGTFWIPNILSPKKLREKFDTMEAQMLRDSKKNQTDFSWMDDLEAENAS